MNYLATFMMLLLSASCFGQTVQNGSVTGGPTGIDQVDNAGWTNCEWSPDLCDVNFPSYSGNSTVAVSPSPDGGTWLGLANTGAVEECASTQITGLTPGTQYTLSFYGACFGTGTGIANSSPAIITASVGTFTQEYSIPMAANTWNTYTLDFTADAGSMTLRMQTFTGDGYAGLDGFRFEECSVQVDIGPDVELCEGQSIVLDASSPNATYLWQDNSTGPTFTVSQAGTYWVEVTDSCGTAADTVMISYLTNEDFDLGSDTSICENQNLLLDASVSNATYLWQDNSTEPTYSVSQAGTYWVTVQTTCGTLSDTIVVEQDDLPVVNLGSDTLLCQGQTHLLDAANEGSSYSWQDNSTGPTFTVSQPGTYSVDVTNGCGTVSDAITVSYQSAAVASLGNDTTLCGGQTLTLDVSSPGTTYLWQDNSTGPSFTVDQAGTYWVVMQNDCGESSDTMEVSYSNPPTVDLGADRVLCEEEVLVVDAASQDAENYTWSDNMTVGPTITIDTEGSYWVFVSNACGVDSDTIEVTTEFCDCRISLPTAFSPNGDFFNDRFNPNINCDLALYRIRIFSRWGELVFESDEILNGWDGTFKGEPLPLDTYALIIDYQFEGRALEQESGMITIIR